MKKIKLTQGKWALVDDEDFEYLNQFKWFANKSGRTYYAGRNVAISKDKRVMQKMHRLIMCCPKNLQVDHINHDGLDNRKCNLRICTADENKKNKRFRKNASSKYKGVHVQTDVYHSKKGLKVYKYWVGTIAGSYIGRFKTEIEAALAYNKKAKELFGEFAYLNKI